MSKKRDYKAEYRRRIERGLARGLSRSQARGHPKAGERGITSGVTKPTSTPELETALMHLRDGQTQKDAANKAGVSTDKFRRFLYGNKLATHQGRKWILTDDRPRRVAAITDGRIKAVTVPNYSEAEKAGSFYHAVSKFISTNQPAYLLPFLEDGVNDIKGNFIPFETNPNELHRIASMDTPDFAEIYQIISN
ncbi:hypothetical protein GCM10017044_08610 [Kordiimonas sediminis]|uniref:Uncharacterized protein n=1 Tax=Kordiimonas sediminis TaxID=1735581 RepID=A0A919E5P4_9PROT|nr:hypothetical protein [Kordiimonas sediminis]GHF16581.1 hypothetical protein GCM10017044_08610 [Kordiimonas sediminis]